MIALTNLGINVSALFAGAGVVGLAIGFGAQALVRDIFSGAFFLFDDAFRKGEYIDIGSVKGTVEKNLSAVVSIAAPPWATAYSTFRGNSASDQLFTRLGNDEAAPARDI